MSLGLEHAGMTIRWQVEVDPYARTVLERHWPHVPRRGDIRLIEPGDLEPVDLLGGGFPCQPVSCAGKQLGERDRRWLWPAMLRVVTMLRPRWVLAENVPGLRTRGADRVLADLEEAGYACWPLVVGADLAGAPFRGERVYLVAQASGAGLEGTEQPTVALESGRRQGSDARGSTRWEAEPAMGRVAHGLPERLARPALTALGNACVPAVVEAIGRAILAVA